MRALLTMAALVGTAGCVMLAVASNGTAKLADLYDVIVSEPAQSEALAARVEAVQRCARGKEEVTQELVAGRLTLAEAAARFERLEARRAEVWVEGPPPVSRPEAYRQVLRWATTRLPGGPRERADAAARLERERARLEAASPG